MLFSEEEAEFVSRAFTYPYQDAQTADGIASKLGKGLEDIRPVLDGLVQDGLIMKFTHWKDGKSYYTSLPVLPGFFEMYFAGPVGKPDSRTSMDSRKKVAKLLETLYLDKGLAMELGASDYPWARVLPVEKTLTIKPGTRIDGRTEILPFEEASKFIRTSHRIALINCACRTKKSCQHPVETCIVFDIAADYMIARGAGRELTEEQALAKLEECEEAGLIHCTTNSQERPQVICNCCTCACVILRGISEMNNPRALMKSNYRPEREGEKCTTCAKCVKSCPFGAHVYHAAHEDGEKDTVIFIEERCIGCGLCAYHCSKDALKMVKTGDKIPVEKPAQVWLAYEAERIH